MRRAAAALSNRHPCPISSVRQLNGWGTLDRARDGGRIQRFYRVPERFHHLEYAEREFTVGPRGVELPVGR
jgi:hypothetical protein